MPQYDYELEPYAVDGIIYGVIGGVLLILLITFCTFMIRRRRNRARRAKLQAVFMATNRFQPTLSVAHQPQPMLYVGGQHQQPQMGYAVPPFGQPPPQYSQHYQQQGIPMGGGQDQFNEPPTTSGPSTRY